MNSIEFLHNKSKSEDGRSEICQSEESVRFIVDACNEFTSESPASSIFDANNQLMFIRTIRNVCVNDLEEIFLDIFISTGIVFKVIKLCRDLVLKISLDETIDNDFKEESLPIVLSYVQFVANFTAYGERAVDYFVNHAGSDLKAVQDLIAVCSVCRSSKITSVVLAIVYNCCRVSSESSKSSIRLDMFCSNRLVLCQLLLVVMDTCGADFTRECEGEANQAMEWLTLISFVLIKEYKVLTIFELVGPTSVAGLDEKRVTHEQVGQSSASVSHLTTIFC